MIKTKSKRWITSPRNARRLIADLTGMAFCDRDCPCGENNRLWWFPPAPRPAGMMPDWVPDWMNGASTDEVWRWLVENGRVGIVDNTEA